MGNLPGVVAVHDLHVWTITSGRVSLSGHVVAEAKDDHVKLLQLVTDMLHERFGIAHSTVQIETEEAYDFARRLTRELGILVGQSSGAALAASLRIGEAAGEGVVVTLFPDSGEKYMSTPLWRLEEAERNPDAEPSPPGLGTDL